ncbi:hypothetical protein OHC33_000443 [Knufia fluminis]|uniref:F-box domain-containing protein n=1 Tax=Knufia fluminis TaxID=191047 RepID=A0AAN8EQD4_9EURO|nr:hypothetical protein OHC33_000443 [Knufia fluminis]
MPVDLGTTDPKQDAEATNILKKENELGRAAKALLESQRRLMREPAITAQMGEISKQMYGQGQIAQTDSLSALPNELKCNIWSFLDGPADKLMFALTCKWNAAMFEMLKIGPEVAQPKAASKGSKSKKKASTTTSNKTSTKKSKRRVVKKSDFIHLIPVLQRLEEWMPPKYRLCFECLRFRRKDVVKEKGRHKGYWTPGVKIQAKKSKLNSKDVNTMRQTGPHCPECTVRRSLQVVKTKGRFKELEEIVDETVGLNS